MEKERYYSVIDYYKGYIEVRDYESGKTLHSLFELDDLLNQQDKHIKKMTKENGRIVFVDGYDENGNVIHKQKFVKYKDTCKELIEEKRKLKQKALIPLSNIGDKLYMIPTKTNGLTYLNAYTLLVISISEIGVRYHLSACEPKKGIEQLYAASPEMFGESIFKTFDEALLRLQDLKRNAN